MNKEDFDLNIKHNRPVCSHVYKMGTSAGLYCGRSLTVLDERFCSSHMSKKERLEWRKIEMETMKNELESLENDISMLRSTLKDNNLSDELSTNTLLKIEEKEKKKQKLNEMYKRINA